MTARLGLEWHKRKHREELDLMRELGLVSKAALDGLRDLYCMRGGNLPNEDKFLAGNLGISLQKWRGIKAHLLSSGYIDVAGNLLRCDLAEFAYAESVSFIEQRKDAGRRSAIARRTRAVQSRATASSSSHRTEELSQHDANVSKGLDEAVVEAPFEPTTKTSTKDLKRHRSGKDATQIFEVLGSSVAPSLVRTMIRTWRSKET